MVQERIYNYFERNPQLHVLFIFDRMNINYTELEQVVWPDNYVYKVFDGAWFNTKYAIRTQIQINKRIPKIIKNINLIGHLKLLLFSFFFNISSTESKLSPGS